MGGVGRGGGLAHRRLEGVLGSSVHEASHRVT